MASGRPHRPNDPSVMASVEAALSSVARPGVLGRLWHWRYEAGLLCGLAAVMLASGYMLGAGWLIAIMTAGLGLLAAGLSWPASRQRLIARAWCVITPHRVRTGCVHAWVQSRDGRLPVVLYTTQAEFGERVVLWCRAGITAADLIAARDILRSACWAGDVRVVASARYPHIVVLEVVRRGPMGQSETVIEGWPYQGEPDAADAEEPALHSGAGPFG